MFDRDWHTGRALSELWSTPEHTDFAPSYLADSNHKKRARLNIISHRLDQILCNWPPRGHIKVPARPEPRTTASPTTPACTCH